MSGGTGAVGGGLAGLVMQMAAPTTTVTPTVAASPRLAQDDYARAYRRAAWAVDQLLVINDTDRIEFMGRGAGYFELAGMSPAEVRRGVDSYIEASTHAMHRLRVRWAARVLMARRASQAEREAATAFNDAMLAGGLHGDGETACTSQRAQPKP